MRRSRFPRLAGKHAGTWARLSWQQRRSVKAATKDSGHYSLSPQFEVMHRGEREVRP
jgi:hypothetical protein